MANLDIYCERLGPELFAEPVNALTNAAFFVAAWMLWRRSRRQNARSAEVVLLIALVVAIGIGSSLFHTFANTWARVFDELPILLFQLAFIWFYARRVIGWRVGAATALTLAFLAAALYSRQFPALLNESLIYLPAIGALLTLGLYHWLTRKFAPFLLISAAGVLVLAVFLRTIDAAVCPQFPLGTHFLWHLTVALVLYLCGLALLVSPQKPGAQ
jgi:hypothetical protein